MNDDVTAQLPPILGHELGGGEARYSAMVWAQSLGAVAMGTMSGPVLCNRGRGRSKELLGSLIFFGRTVTSRLNEQS